MASIISAASQGEAKELEDCKLVAIRCVCCRNGFTLLTPSESTHDLRAQVQTHVQVDTLE